MLRWCNISLLDINNAFTSIMNLVVSASNSGTKSLWIECMRTIEDTVVTLLLWSTTAAFVATFAWTTRSIPGKRGNIFLLCVLQRVATKSWCMCHGGCHRNKMDRWWFDTSITNAYALAKIYLILVPLWWWCCSPRRQPAGEWMHKGMNSTVFLGQCYNAKKFCTSLTIYYRTQYFVTCKIVLKVCCWWKYFFN